MQLKRSLTLALSHPMGERESFAGFLEGGAAEIAGRSLAKTRMAIAVPSPIGWERARVSASSNQILLVECR